VRDFDPLADAREQHSVIADDVTAANCRKADSRRITFARDTFAAIHSAILQFTTKRMSDGFTHC